MVLERESSRDFSEPCGVDRPPLQLGFRSAAPAIHPIRWPELHRPAERFGVTISALCVRLEQLDLLHADDERRLYESKAEAAGQARLW